MEFSHMKYKGLIAIDIDGTLTAVRDQLSPDTIQFLQELVAQDWKLLFVTGRTLDWADKLLQALPFAYTLSVYNGAYTVERPHNTVIKKRYLAFDQAFRVMTLLKDEDVGMAFYGPADRDQRSFLYRHHASLVLATHLKARARAVQENWKEILSLSELPLDYFSAMRLFCLPNIAKKYSFAIEDTLHLTAPMMKDSYDDSFAVVQVTHKEVSKGQAMQSVMTHLGNIPLVIACGDDHNDISMLEKADVAVVMATAPVEVLRLAHIVAPPAKDNGIIQGLTNAIKYAESK